MGNGVTTQGQVRDAAAFPSHAHRSVSVLIDIEDTGLHQEVLDFLGRHPGLNIADPGAPARNGNHADVRVVCPEVARELAGSPFMTAPPITLVVAPEITVSDLRTAIRIGARGVFEWPSEREDLVRIARAGGANRQSDLGRTRGRVIAVAGARGGAGVTFVATHLAAAFAARKSRVVLVDADPAHSDLTAALGVLPDEGARTIGDLLPVIDELSPDHLREVLVDHPKSFSLLLGPSDPDHNVRPGLYRGVVALLALDYDHVIVQVGRPSDPSASGLVAMADAVVLVSALDLLSIYGARRTIAALGISDRPQALLPVMNKAGRSPLSRKDIERILGMRPAVCVRPDSRVPRAQERGRLLPMNGRGAARDVRRLAKLVADVPLSELGV